MNFIDAIKNFYTGYVDFKGRTSRSGYWLAILFYIIVGTVIGTLEGQTVDATTGIATSGPIASAWALVNLLPLLASAVRRMHDVSKSGWFILVPIYNLVLSLSASKPEANKYGAPTK
jgi:uncharacterized membrane protein YhaH (DUF805 family)